MGSKSASSKPLNLRKDFSSTGGKKVSVVLKGKYLYFEGGATSENGGATTSWLPVIKVACDASAEEKGDALMKVLDEFVVGITFTTGVNQNEPAVVATQAGAAKPEAELVRLSGAKDAATFYRKIKLCFVTQKKDEELIHFLSSKKGRGYSFSSIEGKDFYASQYDKKALGLALDEALSYCL